MTTYVSMYFYHVVLKSSGNENSNSKKCFDNLVFLSEKENKFAHEITLETLYIKIQFYTWRNIHEMLENKESLKFLAGSPVGTFWPCLWKNQATVCWNGHGPLPPW